MTAGTVIVAAVLAAMSIGCVVAALRNLREFRRTRTLAPLEVAEVVSTEPRPARLPRGWPPPVELTDHRLAAAYRDYAYDRRDNAVLLGEVTMLVAGAALGAVLPRALTDTWMAIAAGAAIGVGASGQLVRQHLGPRWGRVGGLYERRRAELRKPPPPVEEPPPPRRRWFPWR